MSTPRKNYNYISPYASRPTQQYPSQSQEYISLEMGGRSSQTPNRGGYQHMKSQRRTNQNFFGESYSNSHHKQYTPRKNNDYRKNNTDSSSIASYVHPSMTENPWAELMKRIDSIAKSSISLKTQEDKIDFSHGMETGCGVVDSSDSSGD